MLAAQGIMVVGCAMGMVCAMLMVHRWMKKLRRKAVGTDLKRECLTGRGHKARRHERAKCQRDQQDAGDELMAPSTS
jgi:hypothetical protein